MPKSQDGLPAFLKGGGTVGEMVRQFDWSKTMLGSPDSWPVALQTLVGVMLTAVQLMFVAWGPKRTLIYNDGYVPLLGRKHPTALGAPFLEVWAEAAADLTPLFERVFAGEPIAMDDITLMLQREDHLEEAHFSFSYTPVRDASGVVIGLFCPCSETTNQIFAERDRVWRNSPDLLVVLDSRGICRAINPAVQSFGYEPAEIIGRPLQDFVWPDDKGLIRSAVATTRAGDPLANFEARFADKSGAPRWISWHTTLERNVVYASGRDKTTLKAQGEALKVAQDQLRQAQKLEAVGQLTGGVAHDFNNLLTVIRSSTDFLLKPDLPQERRKRYITAISETVERASKLTNQLLAFARRQPLKPEAFDVAEKIELTADLIRPLLGLNVRLDLKLCQPSCFAYADVSQFEAALIHLAANANEAMPGEGSLAITAELADVIPATRGEPERPGSFIAVSVSDAGAGIHADNLNLIFEPFYTTKEISKGAGLGLSQVFGFAKQSQGEIVVSSQLELGSTFTLYLPRAQDAVEPSKNPSTEVRPGAKLPMSVLIVEDDQAVGPVAADMLHDLGYQTRWALSGPEALSILEHDHASFGLVFSDVLMPGMTGVELARVISACYPHLPVLLTSGYSQDLAQNAASGFRLLQKPYSSSALEAALNQVSGRFIQSVQTVLN